MEEAANIMKKFIKRIGNWFIKVVLPPLLIVVIIIVILAGSTYMVMKWIANSVNKSATSYTTSVSINNSGTATTEMTAQELWNEMKNKGYDVNKYLDGPADLQRLLDAELVTQLPDTRSDVTREIDWDAIYRSKSANKDAGNKKINVLFIGNSKTFVNELPTQFQKLAESFGKEVYAVRTREAWGGRTLNSFLDEDGPSQDFKQRVSETKWDYVVLQQQTDAALVNSEVTQGASRIINYVREHSNKDVIPIYDVWSILNDFDEVAYNQTTSYFETAKAQNGGEVAYIAKSLLECHSKYPEINLFADLVHPTKEGTYLAACCTYGAIYGKSAKGSSFKFGLSDDIATKIQEVAHQVQSSNSSRSSIQGIIKFKRHDSNGNEYYMTYVEPEVFYGWQEAYGFADNNADRNYIKDNILHHYTLEKKRTSSSRSTTTNNNKNSKSKKDDKKSSSTSSGQTQVFVDHPEGYGYNQTYISSTKHEYKDYKQNAPEWTDVSYNGSTMGSFGCGVTSHAIILSGLGIDKTPVDVGQEGGSTWCMDYVQSLGVNMERVDGALSAQQLKDYLQQGKVFVLQYNWGPLALGVSQHFVAMVDVNDQGQFMVLNSYDLGGGAPCDSGWMDASVVEDGLTGAFVYDTGGPGTASGGTTNDSTSTAPGYQAVVATTTEIQRSGSSDGPDVNDAAEGFGIDMDTSPSYIMNTTKINYEDMVEPYTLPFDLLWTLLVLGQSKGFTMSLADLAYNSDIEVSVFDNLTTITDFDEYSYSEPTNAEVSGVVSYNSYDQWDVRKSVDVGHHKHEYPDDPYVKPVPRGYINRTEVTYNNTVNAALTKAHTWIADYDLRYENSSQMGTENVGGNKLDDQINIYGTKYSRGDDECEAVQKAVNEVVSLANKEFEELGKIANDKEKNITPHPPISAADVNKSEVFVKTWVNRVDIKQTTVDRTDTQKYTALTPTLVINDSIKTSKSSKQILTSMDNFLFIGDSRYDGVDAISNLGKNTNNLGIGSARIDEWRDVARNGGSGTVQRKQVNITGNYSGISIQLGANSLWKTPGTAIIEMKDFIEALKKIHPNTAIFVNSCLPDTDYSQGDINAFNNGIKDYCNSTDNVYYIDISTNLVDSSGYIKKEYTADGCHLSSSEAESIFANNIKKGVLGKTSSSGRTISRENFVSLFNKSKYIDNKNNILSAPEWLFEILAENEKTKNMVDIIKYLLYKATGTSYGVTELDISLFDPLNFHKVQSGTDASGTSNDLISFIDSMEGEGEKSGEDYVVYYTAADGCLNVGSGVVVKFGDGSTRFTELIGEPYVGQIVSKEIYYKMREQEFKEITDVLDAELATQGVTLTTYQRDAMISCLYNVGTGYAKRIVAAYKNGGNEGYWNETKNYVHTVYGEWLLGLQRRREQEYKLFTTGVYEWPY